MTNSERRRYFRINDTIGLSYKPLEDAVNGESSNADNIEITTAHVLANIDRELTTLVNVLWKKDPAIAKTLGLLNRKIEVLTDEIIGDERAIVEREQLDTKVNISGCGIAFDCAEKMAEDQQLRLFITLKPANTHITLNGVVVSCEKNGETPAKPYHLRIRFTEEETAAQEALIQHIVQRQFAMKKE